MKICIAQTRPFKGDIDKNIAYHKRLIDLAVSHDAGMIIFPELSLTGYEPALASELAMEPGDARFDDFQSIANARQITIGVGMPTKSDKGICISMLLFYPQKPRQVYSKKYLHPDEEAFFVSGQNITCLYIDENHIAPAICYEISVPVHAKKAIERGAKIYIASVAKSVNGIDKALSRLSEIARQYSITVLMANCIGACDGNICAGKSSVWNDKGLLLAQLSNIQEGILILDTESQKATEIKV